MLHQAKFQILCCIFLCSEASLQSLPSCANVSDSFLGLCSKVDNYSHLEYPEPTPILVKVVLMIEDVIGIDQEAQVINLRLKLGLTWNDTRIALAYSNLNKPKYYYKVQHNEFKKIWKPDIQFLNSVSTSLWNNENNKIFEESLEEVSWMQSYTVSISCGMDFSTYPFDDHECYLKLWHIGGISEFVLLDEPEIVIDNEEVIWQRSSFDISFKSIESSIKTIQSSKISFTESYSLATIKMNLKRKYQERRTVLIEFIFPSFTYSILALISYFICVESVPGRMGLLVTLYLIAINTYVSTSQGITGNNVLMDTWFVGCIAPIIFAILEYGALLAIVKFKKGYISGKFVDSRVIDKISFAVSFIYITIFVILFFLPIYV